MSTYTFVGNLGLIMTQFFDTLQAKISSLTSSLHRNDNLLKVTGLTPEHAAFAMAQFYSAHKNRSFLCVVTDVEQAKQIESILFSLIEQAKIFVVSGNESNPYLHLLASESTLFERFAVLDQLAQQPKGVIVLTTIEALALKVPPPTFFKEHSFSLQVSDILGPHELAKKLIELGYSHSTTVEEPGTFVQKGEIFDIFPISHRPVRIHYFDDMVEEIFLIDLETQKTIKDQKFDQVRVGVCPGTLTQTAYATQLRENIPMPGPAYKNRFEARKALFNHLQDNQLFESYPYYTPLFFAQPATLLDYLGDCDIHFFDYSHSLDELLSFFEEMRADYETQLADLESTLLLSAPETLYNTELQKTLENLSALAFDQIDIDALDTQQGNATHLKIESSRAFLYRNVGSTANRQEFLAKSLKFIQEYFKLSGQIVFALKNDSTKDELGHFFEHLSFDSDILKRISFLKTPLSSGFFYENEKTLVLAEADFFAAKKTVSKGPSKKQLDLFAEQISTLKVGDFVIHSEHGLGEYLGLESHEFSGISSDFLVLKYADNDKVYVPVYKLNLIQKHAGEAAGLKPESLRTNKFAAMKTRARTSAKKLAFDLLRLQAERQSSEAYAFHPPDDYFEEFETAFPFEETPDQLQAISNVLEDMQKPNPMDHLVCGDVGFGKTEVAMRAAFKAVQDKKQVVVLVPTTVLALQHYTSFTKRYKDFPISIEFLSRFKSPKESTQIKSKLEEGEIDIIIGTHRILSDSIKFKDLGLVIVDEEQRFGVGHKEKLKVLKSSVDFLTLTATPIPRTLQLAFLGIRDMSLIQTPPPKRQSIKTYVIKQDDLTLQSALKKELNRGGQVFIVHNKVHDIEHYTHYIQELVPEAKIVFAHGQLPERELEKRMKAFYAGEYQILISTTIIESGIDIPNANTMIVDRADTYGLSQLHQLRGRIGRSDKKAYAYLVVPNNRSLTPVAEKRLKALQTYADIGSGFSIASCDLEIRGAGDILGGDQSGHVEAVGLELYMELLKEAIFELRGEKKLVRKDIEITLPQAAFIPNHFIKDSSQRLKFYKRLSNCEDLQQLELIRDELNDMYGLFPTELETLFCVLSSRINLQSCGIKSIQVAGKLIRFVFEKSFLEANDELRNNVVDFFLKRPKVYQFSPDYKVSYNHKEEITPSFLVEFSKDIAQQILPC